MPLILITSLFNKALKLQGEVGCWSHLALPGFKLNLLRYRFRGAVISVTSVWVIDFVNNPPFVLRAGRTFTRPCDLWVYYNPLYHGGEKKKSGRVAKDSEGWLSFFIGYRGSSKQCLEFLDKLLQKCRWNLHCLFSSVLFFFHFYPIFCGVHVPVSSRWSNAKDFLSSVMF